MICSTVEEEIIPPAVIHWKCYFLIFLLDSNNCFSWQAFITSHICSIWSLIVDSFASMSTAATITRRSYDGILNFLEIVHTYIQTHIQTHTYTHTHKLSFSPVFSATGMFFRCQPRLQFGRDTCCAGPYLSMITPQVPPPLGFSCLRHSFSRSSVGPSCLSLVLSLPSFTYRTASGCWI